MPLGPGARLGSYDVVGPLGAGGMGEVYRARDVKLKREVAIKVLPDTFSRDADRVERFRREAEVLASLNHPRIAAIYDLVESEAAPFLVLELVEGETLAERLVRGPIAGEAALEIAAQIAEAVEAAHERGVIHRDLKPANIKITADGQVKVLDFGLAKLRRGAGGPPDSDVSTMMSTTPGLILGTAAYMSPEQANGAEASRASDMWSFGCIVYEMLAGRRPFEGSTISEVLANVLKTAPDWQRLPADTPEPVRRLLRRALQKDHKLRSRDMRDARLEIDDARNITSAPERAGKGGSTRRERLAWASALLVIAAVATFFGSRAFRPAPAAAELRLDLNTTPTRNQSLALSPDGLSIVFVASTDGPPRLWLRSLDSSATRPLAGTERGSNPFWSPDGRSVGFFADSKLKRVDLDGGSPQTLAPSAVPFGATWGSDGTILFGNNPGGPILRVSAAGGNPVPASRIATAQERGHAFPMFLPDERHFLFYSIGGPEARGVYIGQLDDLNSTRLLGADGPAAYSATGHLLFVRDGKLWAQSFDPDSRKLSADPFVVADGVGAGTALSASNTGSIAYRTPPVDSGRRQLVWVDRSGRERAKEVYADTAALGPALSPDRRRVAVYRETDGNMDIWSYEMGRRAWDRITFDLGDDIYPVWSPDGVSVMFGAVRSNTGVVDLYRRRLGAAHGAEELLLSTPQGKFPTDWSSDGRFILYDSLDPKRGTDLWALPLGGSKTPLEVVRTDFNESQGQFSPDVKWIAYQSDRTGRKEIYLRPFPGPGGDLRVSIDGGSQPRWNGSGDELFFIGGDDRLMAVPMRVAAVSKVLEPGVPVGLFATTVGSTVTLAYRQQYLAAADGQSFVMHSSVAGGSASPISLILNWRPRQP